MKEGIPEAHQLGKAQQNSQHSKSGNGTPAAGGRPAPDIRRLFQAGRAVGGLRVVDVGLEYQGLAQVNRVLVVVCKGHNSRRPIRKMMLLQMISRLSHNYRMVRGILQRDATLSISRILR